jgi:hypothetical protein
MPASDIPTYVQGYRFSDAAGFYESGTQTFLDQAGYGLNSNLVVNAGAPVFATVGGARCLHLNNTFHGVAPMPIPWMGSFVMVVKPEYSSGGTLTRDLFCFGDSTSGTANGRLYMQHTSTQRRVGVSAPANATVNFNTRTDNNLVVIGGALDTETRRAYITNDGITIPTVLAPASTINSLGIYFGAGVNGMRMGDLNTTPSDLTEFTDFFAYVFEVHFFTENIWLRYPTEAAALMGELRTAYGV